MNKKELESNNEDFFEDSNNDFIPESTKRSICINEADALLNTQITNIKRNKLLDKSYNIMEFEIDKLLIRQNADITDDFDKEKVEYLNLLTKNLFR